MNTSRVSSKPATDPDVRAAARIAFRHRTAAHCASGSLRDLLEHHGLSYAAGPPSEGLAFGLGAGLGFGYAELDGQRPPLLMVGRSGTLERDFCANLDLSFALQQTDDAQEGWSLLRVQLDRGRPTLIWTDMKLLGYLNVRMHDTHHTVVATGYDERAGVAWLADNDRAELQRVPLEALARARDSHAFPYGPNRHAVWAIDFPRSLPDPRRAVAAAIERSIENVRSPDDARMGIGGLEAFEAGYRGWPERLGNGLPAMMKALRVFIARAGTGGAMFRFLQRDFLADASAILDDEQLAATACVYEELADEWVRLAGLAGGEDAFAAHADGLATVRRIVRLERAGVGALAVWLARRGDRRPAF